MSTTRYKLIERRKKIGLTQQELAKKANISRAYLANIEGGKYTPSLEVAYKISMLVGIPIDELFL